MMKCWICGVLLLALLGCSSSKDDGPPKDGAYAASGATAGNTLPGVPEESAEMDAALPSTDPALKNPPVENAPAAPVVKSPAVESPAVESPVSKASDHLPSVEDIPASPAESAMPIREAIPTTAPRTRMAQRELRADLAPEKLVEFLAGADRDMQTIVSGESGIEDPEEARELLLQIIRMKLEASRRLASDGSASQAMASEGARGELQSLSHLAALGELKAAEELEKLAEKNLSSSDPRLVSDSRLVLIGFAIENLQNGKSDAPTKIVDYVKQLATTAPPDDVPAMMVMGEARDILARYGYDAEAKQVRDAIIDVFADSPDVAIAQMAAQVAGNVRFDGIEKLRAQVIDGETVSVDVWREAVETLIDESADLQTVQYLAGAALEFEGMGSDLLPQALIATTYDVMSRRFADANSATGREVDLAVRAKRAREAVIGRIFDPALPSVDDSQLSILDYRGKVVMMPFWAMAFPESLQILPSLNELQKTYPDDVAIVGMNLDVSGTPLREFQRDNQLSFPSYRAESSATESVANPVASQFGLVSMPFVVILDRDGRVASLDFTGRRLAETVKSLIERE